MADLRPACLEVLRQLGCGHAECVYHKALAIELQNHPNVKHLETEKHVPIVYTAANHTHTVGSCRVDLIYTEVDTQKRVLVELKATASSAGAGGTHQVEKYVRLLGRVDEAYLVNFKQVSEGGVDFLRIV